MTARDDILNRISNALADLPPVPDIPRDYRTTQDADLTLLTHRLEDYGANVTRTSPAGVADVLARLVRGTTVVPAGFPDTYLPPLDALGDMPPLIPEVLDRVATVVTTCALAIAETGTIILNGGPGQGRRALTLIPDHHVVVVHTSQVVGSVPDALRVLDPLRPQTWISGPSATSDIELNRVEGVHGPRSFDVVLIADAHEPFSSSH